MQRKSTTCALAALLLAAIAGAQTAPEMFRGDIIDTNMASRGTAFHVTCSRFASEKARTRAAALS